MAKLRKMLGRADSPFIQSLMPLIMQSRKAIYQYVFALAHGADKGTFYYSDWIRK